MLKHLIIEQVKSLYKVDVPRRSERNTRGRPRKDLEGLQTLPCAILSEIDEVSEQKNMMSLPGKSTAQQMTTKIDQKEYQTTEEQNEELKEDANCV